MWIHKPASKLVKIKSTNAQRTMKPKFRWNIRKYLISLNMFILIHMQLLNSLNFLCNRLHWSTLVIHDDFVLYLLESIPCRTRYDARVHILHYNITRDVLFIFVRAPTISPKSAKKIHLFRKNLLCTPIKPLRYHYESPKRNTFSSFTDKYHGISLRFLFLGKDVYKVQIVNEWITVLVH